MSSRHLFAICSLLCLANLCFASDVHALSLLEEEELELSIGAFARTRLTATSTDGGAIEPGADVVMARLLASAKFKDLGQALLILETVNDPSIFDAIIDVNLGLPAGLAVGLMRVPLSREMLINIPVISAYDRAWLSATLAPRRRVGALLHGAWALGSITINPQFGVFNPTTSLRAGEDGLLVVGSVDVTHTSRINLHIAGMTHALEPDPVLDPVTMLPLVTYTPGEQLDVAVFYDGDHLRVLAEALLVKPETEGAEMPLGLHSFVAYKFSPAAHRFEYEPALSADYVVLPDGSDMERVTANMHWLLQGRNLQASLGYGWESRQVVTHRVLGEFQVMF